MVHSEGLSVISRKINRLGWCMSALSSSHPVCADILLALLPQVERLVCDAARTSRDGGGEKWCDRRRAPTRARPAPRTRKGAIKCRPVWAGAAGLSDFSPHSPLSHAHRSSRRASAKGLKLSILCVPSFPCWLLCFFAKTNRLPAHPQWNPLLCKRGSNGYDTIEAPFCGQYQARKWGHAVICCSVTVLEI